MCWFTLRTCHLHSPMPWLLYARLSRIVAWNVVNFTFSRSSSSQSRLASTKNL